MLGRERLLEQRVLLEVKHPQAEVERGPHVSIGLAEFILRERCALDGGAGWPKGRERAGFCRRHDIGG